MSDVPEVLDRLLVLLLVFFSDIVADRRTVAEAGALTPGAKAAPFARGAGESGDANGRKGARLGCPRVSLAIGSIEGAVGCPRVRVYVVKRGKGGRGRRGDFVGGASRRFALVIRSVEDSEAARTRQGRARGGGRRRRLWPGWLERGGGASEDPEGRGSWRGAATLDERTSWRTANVLDEHPNGARRPPPVRVVWSFLVPASVSATATRSRGPPHVAAGGKHSRRVPGHALSQHLRPPSVSHDGKGQFPENTPNQFSLGLKFRWSHQMLLEDLHHPVL